MSYSTVPQFRAFVDRLTSSGSRSTGQWGRSGTAQDANIQLCLDAGSVKINALARQGGLATPITQASLGVTASEWAEVLSWLQTCEMACATGHNLFPGHDTPRFKEAREACRDDLKLLAQGILLPTTGAGAGGGFEYVTTTGGPPINFTSISLGRMRVSIP